MKDRTISDPIDAYYCLSLQRLKGALDDGVVDQAHHDSLTSLIATMHTYFLAKAGADPDLDVFSDYDENTGVATIIRGDERVRVLSGLPVLARDVIETGSNGTIGVTFSDNTVFSAGPNSRIVMEQFSFDSKSFKGSLLARMDRGTLSVVSGDIARHSKDAMKIKTPSVVLGVRGTTFLVKVDPE